jgi:hypothetical protein
LRRLKASRSIMMIPPKGMFDQDYRTSCNSHMGSDPEARGMGEPGLAPPVLTGSETWPIVGSGAQCYPAHIPGPLTVHIIDVCSNQALLRSVWLFCASADLLHIRPGKRPAWR